MCFYLCHCHGTSMWQVENLQLAVHWVEHLDSTKISPAAENSCNQSCWNDWKIVSWILSVLRDIRVWLLSARKCKTVGQHRIHNTFKELVFLSFFLCLKAIRQVGWSVIKMMNNQWSNWLNFEQYLVVKGRSILVKLFNMPQSGLNHQSAVTVASRIVASIISFHVYL